jgi:hypothetical protein
MDGEDLGQPQVQRSEVARNLPIAGCAQRVERLPRGSHHLSHGDRVLGQQRGVGVMWYSAYAIGTTNAACAVSQPGTSALIVVGNPAAENTDCSCRKRGVAAPLASPSIVFC